jgi:hypothetical protein
MAATTVERDTLRKGQEPLPALQELKLSAQKCLAGTIAVLSAGYLAMGTSALNLVCLGRFEETVDNSAGAAGDKYARVLAGAFWWANGDTIVQADMGKVCYVMDNQTVAKADGGGTRSKAGILLEVDSVKGVLVLMGPAVVTL